LLIVFHMYALHMSDVNKEATYLSDNVCGIYFMLLCIIFIDHVTLTYDLLTLAMCGELSSHVQCTYQFLASYNYSFLSYV